MRPILAIGGAVFLSLAAMTAVDAAQPARFNDCPLLGAMRDYEAVAAPDWGNWDRRELTVDDGTGGDKAITAVGGLCQQDYAEKEGKTDGTTLEISENYKAAMRQLGAEIMRDQPGYVVGHLKKDGKDIWLNVSSTRDDGYHVAEVFVEPFKRSLLPPGGNDFRLLGHMPGYVAEQPDKKNFAEYAFPTNDGDFKIRGSPHHRHLSAAGEGAATQGDADGDHPELSRGAAGAGSGAIAR